MLINSILVLYNKMMINNVKGARTVSIDTITFYSKQQLCVPQNNMMMFKYGTVPYRTTVRYYFLYQYT
jgi:hypothetical protein